MSVVIAAECTGGEVTFLAGHEGFGVAALTVGQVRSLGLGLVRHHVEGVPGHAHVTGKKTDSVRRRLSRMSVLVVSPAIP